MQIQLRQVEIIEALKQYIGKQGINLQNKTVEVAFTSGRKDNGLSADIVIEDCAVIPGLDEEQRPALTLVATPIAIAAPAEAPAAPAVAPATGTDAAGPVSTSSLFS